MIPMQHAQDSAINRQRRAVADRNAGPSYGLRRFFTYVTFLIVATLLLRQLFSGFQTILELSRQAEAAKAAHPTTSEQPHGHRVSTAAASAAFIVEVGAYLDAERREADPLEYPIWWHAPFYTGSGEQNICMSFPRRVLPHAVLVMDG